MLHVVLCRNNGTVDSFPLPPELETDVTRPVEARLHMRTQTIWFFFLVVTGFSLAIELTFELFRQILSR